MQRETILALFQKANEANEGAVTFEVEAVSNAKAAIERLERDEDKLFHIILLDILLPDLNGYEVLPTLRTLVGEDVAIVMASAHSHISLVQLCVRRGADAFLVKPLNSEEVRHIWQFIKELPGGFFQEFVGSRSPCSRSEQRRRASREGPSEPGTSTTSMHEPSIVPSFSSDARTASPERLDDHVVLRRAQTSSAGPNDDGFPTICSRSGSDVFVCGGTLPLAQSTGCAPGGAGARSTPTFPETDPPAFPGPEIARVAIPQRATAVRGGCGGPCGPCGPCDHVCMSPTSAPVTSNASNSPTSSLSTRSGLLDVELQAELDGFNLRSDSNEPLAGRNDSNNPVAADCAQQ